MTAYHELLTSSARVNLLDPNSAVQDALLEDFIARFPHWRENPYLKTWPRKHRLLLALITGKRRWLLHVLLKTNQMIKR